MKMLLCSKMNGNGNDFIMINNMDKKYSTESLSSMALNLCRRREAVGADGILAAEPSEHADFKMRLFNRDGSEGEMCGNGSRCIARYAFEKGIVNSSDMIFETLGGDVHASVNGSMAALHLAPISLENVTVGMSASVDGIEFNYTFITVGVPHTVIFEKARSRTREGYVAFGRAVRNIKELFPEGTNVNFAVPSDGALDVLTYERGVEDLTLSCGTGSVASTIASYLSGITGACVDVRNPGGINRLTLSFDTPGYVCPKLEGKTMFVAEISVFDDILDS